MLGLSAESEAQLHAFRKRLQMSLVDQSLLDGLVFSSRRCGWAWARPHQPALPFCVFFFPQEIRWSDPGSGSKTNSQTLIFTAIKALRANNFKAWRMMTPGFVPFCASPNRKWLCILRETPVKCLWRKADFNCFKKGSECSSLAQGLNSLGWKGELEDYFRHENFFQFYMFVFQVPKQFARYILLNIVREE